MPQSQQLTLSALGARPPCLAGADVEGAGACSVAATVVGYERATICRAVTAGAQTHMSVHQHVHALWFTRFILQPPFD